MMSAPRSILYMALPSIAISFPDRRQSDGAVAESIFYRRGYQYCRFFLLRRHLKLHC